MPRLCMLSTPPASSNLRIASFRRMIQRSKYLGVAIPTPLVRCVVAAAPHMHLMKNLCMDDQSGHSQVCALCGSVHSHDQVLLSEMEPEFHDFNAQSRCLFLLWIFLYRFSSVVFHQKHASLCGTCGHVWTISAQWLLALIIWKDLRMVTLQHPCFQFTLQDEHAHILRHRYHAGSALQGTGRHEQCPGGCWRGLGFFRCGCCQGFTPLLRREWYDIIHDNVAWLSHILSHR